MKVVLLLGAGATWETRALSLLTGHRDLVVLKRCVDVDDLLATATSGQADTAVVAIEAPGFDLAAVDHLVKHGVRAVALVGDDAGTVRASRIGVRATVGVDDLEALPDAITADHQPAPEPPPTPDDPPPPSQGRVVAVWGPAGAPGRTTVATSLAAALGSRARTTLVDADPYGGTVAQALGVLDEVSGLLSAARLAGSGMLEERFASVQRAFDRQFTVVTGLPRPDRWTEVRPGTVELLAETASRQGHVVIDTGFGLDDDDLGGRPGRNQLTLAALEVADEVLVVGTADPVGLSRLVRALVDLRERRPLTSTRVVVNRMRPTIGWSERDVTQMLSDFSRPVGLHFLPEDRPTVDRALVTGSTLLETSAGQSPRRRDRRGSPTPSSRGRPRTKVGARAAPATYSGCEQQVQPTRGEADHRHQQRQLTGELVLLRQQVDRAVVRGDHADHMADHHREHLEGRQRGRVVGEEVGHLPVRRAEPVGPVAERVAHVGRSSAARPPAGRSGSARSRSRSRSARSSVRTGWAARAADGRDRHRSASCRA